MTNADGFTLAPTVLYCMNPKQDRLAAASVPTEIGEALLVFRSEEEAEKFRHDTGRCPASEGFRAVNLSNEEISGVLDIHGLGAVAMPETWTGDDSSYVDLFTRDNFLELLEVSEPA